MAETKRWMAERIAAISVMEAGTEKVEALLALCEASEQLRELLPEVLEAVEKNIEAPQNRIPVVCEIARKLPKEQQEQKLGEALESAKEIDSTWDHVKALSAIAENVQPEQTVLLHKVLDAVSTVKKTGWDSVNDVLKAVSKKLRPEQTDLWKKLLKNTQAIPDSSRSDVLIAIVENLSPDRQINILREVLDIASSLKKEYHCAPVLKAIVERLSFKQDDQAELLQQILEIVLTVTSGYYFEDVLRSLAKKWPCEHPGLWEKGLEAAENIRVRDNQDSANILIAVTETLPIEQSVFLNEVLRIASTIENEWHRLRVLIVVAQNPLSSQPKIAELLLDLIDSIQQEYIYYPDLISVIKKIAPERQKDLISRMSSLQRGALEQVKNKEISLNSERFKEEKEEISLTLGCITRSLLPNQTDLYLKVLEVVKALPFSSLQRDVLRRIVGNISSKQTEICQITLDFICDLEGAWTRNDLLSRLSEKLNTTQKIEALGTALEYVSGWNSSKLLTETIKRFPVGETDLCLKALGKINSLGVDENRSEPLIAIAEKLPINRVKLWQIALNLAKTTRYVEHFFKALSALLERMPQDRIELWELALKISQRINLSGQTGVFGDSVRDITPEELRVRSAIATFKKLPLGQARLWIKALEISYSIESAKFRAEALIEVAAIIPVEYQIEVLRDALGAAQGIEEQEIRAIALTKIAEQLPPDQTERWIQVSEIAANIEGWSRSKALISIAQKLPIEQKKSWEKVLGATQDLANEKSVTMMGFFLSEEDQDIYPRLLKVIASRLSPRDHEEGWREVQRLALAESREPVCYQAMGTIAKKLDKAKQAEIVGQMWKIAVQFSSDFHSPASFEDYADKPARTQGDLWQEALRAAKKIRDRNKCVYLLCGVAICEGEGFTIFPHALMTATEIADEDKRADALTAIAESLPQNIPDDFLRQLTEAAHGIIERKHRLKALKPIAPRLPAPERLATTYPLDTVLELIRAQADDRTRTQTLSALAPHLPAGLLPNALQLLENDTIQDEALRAEAFSNLIPYLPFLSSQNLLWRALEILQPATPNETDETDSSDDPDYIPFRDDLHRRDALLALLPYLATPEHYATAFKIAIAIPSNDHRARLLIAIAAAIAAARVRRLVATQDETPENLATASLDRLVDQLWQQVAENPQNLQLGDRLFLLAALAPSLPDDKLPIACEQLIALHQEARDAERLNETKIANAIPQAADTIAQRWRHGRCFGSTPSEPRSTDAATHLQALADLTLHRQNQTDRYQWRLSSYLDLGFSTPNYLDHDAAIWAELARHPYGLDRRYSERQYKALQAINNYEQDTKKQAEYIDQLVPVLDPKHSIEAQRIARAIKNSVDRASALVSIACRFAEARPAARDAIKAVGTTNNTNRINTLRLFGRLAREMPELLPEIFDVIDGYDQPDADRSVRYVILIAIETHLPIRTAREIRSTPYCNDELWNRAIALLRRGYRNALQAGSLRNESDKGDDTLDLKDEVEALTNLLLIRDLFPPMTVGILGGWGGGKSYIMHLMQQRMTEIRCEPITEDKAWNPDPNNEKLSPYVGHIYQIRFDAWTFAKGNLWASLMQTIFLELDRQISIEQQLASILAEETEDTDKARNAARAKALREDTSHYWRILYEADDGDRQDLIDRLLADGKHEKLKRDIEAGKFADVLWQQLRETNSAETEKLDALQAELAEKRQTLTTEKKKIHQEIADDRLSLQLDRAIGMAGVILSNRISQPIFNALQKEIRKEIEKAFKTSQDETKDKGVADDLEAVDLEALETTVRKAAITVFERRNERIELFSLLTWSWRNRSKIILFVVFALVAIYTPSAIDTWLAEWPPAWFPAWLPTQIDLLLSKILATLTALTPAIVTGQRLLKSSQTWFDETRLAVREYEKKIEALPQQIDTRRAQLIDKTQRRQLSDLESEIEALEAKVQAQRQRIPQNQYASLESFVRDRLDNASYSQHLGLMHQVKDDLADLSRRLLPPTNSAEFKTKIGNLEKVFPRGPARVIVYIDDLDRCPPDKVVEVLEAVQLLVQTPLFIAVLAIDERYITRALEQHYKGVLSRNGHPSASDYLEKIIQLPYRVRSISDKALSSYLQSQILIQDNTIGSAKFSEFTRDEFTLLLDCCKHIDLSPRTLKRLTNVYKLFKIVCRTRGTQLTLEQQQTILALLALSGRYPDLMRHIFNAIEACFEENRNAKKAKAIQKARTLRYHHTPDQEEFIPHLQTRLCDFFTLKLIPERDRIAKHEIDKLMHDAIQTKIIPNDFILETLTHEIFNLIRSFSFVGDIGDEDTAQFTSQTGIN